jgi:hypothetical protein
MAAASLVRAETAHLADDRFRLSARQSGHDCDGDVSITPGPVPRYRFATGR